MPGYDSSKDSSSSSKDFKDPVKSQPSAYDSTQPAAPKLPAAPPKPPDPKAHYKKSVVIVQCDRCQKENEKSSKAPVFTHNRFPNLCDVCQELLLAAWNERGSTGPTIPGA